MSEVKKSKKTVQGTVVSAKTEKTIVVEVSFRKQDPRFGKTIRQSKRVMAHDEKKEAREGDVVVIEESRPYSKMKRYALQKVVTRRAEEVTAV